MLCGSVYQISKIKCELYKVNLRAAKKRKQEVNISSEQNVQHTAENTKIKRQRKALEKEYDIKSNRCQFLKYDKLDNGREKSKPAIKILDPLPLNPNSYESVKLVLRKTGLDAGISRYT